MKRKRRSLEEIGSSLLEAKGLLLQGWTVKKVCETLKINEATYYRWQQHYGAPNKFELKPLLDAAEKTCRNRGTRMEKFIKPSVKRTGINPWELERLLQLKLNFTRRIQGRHEGASNKQIHASLSFSERIPMEPGVESADFGPCITPTEGVKNK